MHSLDACCCAKLECCVHKSNMLSRLSSLLSLHCLSHPHVINYELAETSVCGGMAVGQGDHTLRRNSGTFSQFLSHPFRMFVKRSGSNSQFNGVISNSLKCWLGYNFYYTRFRLYRHRIYRLFGYNGNFLAGGILI